jgi:magnesium and cobalt exporter, CNNM family
VVGLNLGLELALALIILALHMMSVALARALRTYSRSRLEAQCERHGRPERADAIAIADERTERSAETTAVLTGLGLAALLGAAAAEVAPRLEVEAVVAIALAIGALGHVAAGVIGRVHAEALLDCIWPIATLLRRLTTPFTLLSRAVEALAYRVARRSPSSPRPVSVEVEIHSSIDEPAQDFEAGLPDSTRALLERAVELTRRDVAEMMTPQTSILALPVTASAAEAAQAFREWGHSRIPLFGANRDDIVGILHVKDLFSALADPQRVQPPSPRKLARPAFCVPETKNANELLDEFRTKRTHQAIVLDEYGGVAGLITLEDLLEQIVGPIDDEHDEPTPADSIHPLGNGSYDVEAALSLEQLNERLGLHLPTNGDYQTVGGFAFNMLGRLPEQGVSFEYEGVLFTVVEVSDHSIRRLRVDLQEVARNR